MLGCVFFVLQIYGTLEERGDFLMYGYKISPVLNRIYYSSGNNLTIYAVFDYQDSIMCNWKTIPKEITTNNKREQLLIKYYNWPCVHHITLFHLANKNLQCSLIIYIFSLSPFTIIIVQWYYSTFVRRWRTSENMLFPHQRSSQSTHSDFLLRSQSKPGWRFERENSFVFTDKCITK